MDAETQGNPRGDMRVSDAERDLAVAELSEHFQAGRLTQEEFSERSGNALQARTWADLGGLFTDLPRQGTVPAMPTVGPPQDPFSGPAAPRHPGRGLLTARVVIACVIASTVLSGLFGNDGHAHPASWVFPVVLLTLLFLRLTRRARRR